MLDAVSQAEIIDKGRRKRARDRYPGGFPVLPPVPTGRYTDPDFAAMEGEAVFGRSWLFVAHADQLPQSGDFLTLTQLARPLFLVRGEDGRIRAFHNACQHRGGPVVQAAAGNAGRRLVCSYHAWTYDLAGQLVTSDGDYATTEPDAWAAARAAVAKRPILELVPAAPADAASGFLNAWAEFGLDTAKSRGSFKSAIPKPNLMKFPG